MMKLIVLVLALSVCNVSSKPTEMFDASAYLEQFNYLKGDDRSLLTNSQVNSEANQILSEALRQFQENMGLEVTGEMNKETKMVMEEPRCGLTDEVSTSETKLMKRYTLARSKWGSKKLTYRIVKYSKWMNKGEVDKLVAKAFTYWSRYTPLRFYRRTSGYATIIILFGAYRHGDKYPFDGRGKVLAHAFYPRYGGDAHFDDSEHWSNSGKSRGTISFLQVATHEFGHSLGLGHSRVRAAIMYPSYHYMSRFNLNRDDIAGIRRLYGY